MSKLTPAEAREKHARNLKASVPDIVRGVNNVTEAPGEKAAANVAKMRQNLLEAIDSGKWADNVSAVTLDEWKTDMIDKGVNRIAAGIDGAANKVESFFTKLFPYQDRLVTEIQRMPDLTLEDSIARMTKMVRGMADFENK